MGCSHTHVAVKNWEGYLSCRDSHRGARGCQPHTGLPDPEHQCQEEKTPQGLAVKIRRDLLWWRAAVDPDILLKGLSTDLLTNTISSSEGKAAQKVSGTYVEEMDSPVSSKAWKGSPFKDKSASRHHCSFVDPSPQTACRH